MIFDCYENLIDIVLVKSISRLARNTVDLLETVNKLRSMGIEMIFDQENIITSKISNDVFVAALTAIAQAEVVRKIFNLYLSGYSIGLITNEKYIGNVILGKTYTGVFPNNKQQINSGVQEKYLMEDAHEPIVEFEKFEQVQEEMKRRINIEIVDGKVKRKGTHYSIKKEKKD